MKILVSSCLFGYSVRYDGRSKDNLVKNIIFQGQEIFPFCPEVSGGLEIPRECAEIEIGKNGTDVIDGDAKVLTISHKDVTDFFIKGAKKTLEFVRENNLTHFALLEKSPSCGYQMIYDGNFNHTLKKGCGVTVALLLKNGLKPYSKYYQKYKSI